MKRRYSAGSSATGISKLLKMDGSNDAVRAGGTSEFYNFGFNSFTFFVSFIPAGAENDLCRLIYKTAGAHATFDGYVFFLQSRRFTFLTAATGDLQNRWRMDSPTMPFGTLKVGQMNRALVERNTNDESSAQDIENYRFSLNGYEPTKSLAQSVITPNMTNPHSLFLGSNSVDGSDVVASLPLKGYLGVSGILNRATTEAERLAFMDAGVIPVSGAKSIYNNSVDFGKVSPDVTSVGNNADLLNYTDAECGIPDPSEQRVWLHEDAVIYFAASGIKTFTASRNLIITKIARGFNGNMTGTATHKRGGSTINTYTLDFPANNINTGLGIDMLEGDTLDINITTISGTGFIELFY